MFCTKVSVYDGIVIAILLLSSFLLLFRPWARSEKGSRLSVSTPEGEQVYSLAEDRTLTVGSNGHTLTVQIAYGRACVRDSDCPDQICVRGGWIESVGESLICAPAGVRVTIISGEGGDGDVDFIAG